MFRCAICGTVGNKGHKVDCWLNTETWTEDEIKRIKLRRNGEILNLNKMPVIKRNV